MKSTIDDNVNNVNNTDSNLVNNNHDHVCNFYLGIDIAKYKHVLSVMDDNNQVVLKNYTFNNTRTGLSNLYDQIVKYQKQGSVHVACEATGHYWLNLFQFLWNKEIDMTVFNPLAVASFRNTGLRGSKTDSADSALIAKVLKFGVGKPRQLPNESLFQLKELSRFHQQLTQQKTAIKLKIMNILDQVFPEFTSVFKDINGRTARKVLEDYPDPQDLADVSTIKLTNLIKKISRSYYQKADAQRLKQKASQTIGLRFGLESFTLQLKILLQQIQGLEDQIDLIEKEIEKLVKQTNTTLTTIPGVSNIVAATILGECANFKSNGPQSLLAFAGLDPKKRESGTHKGKTKISKRGSRNLRHALWMAATSARQCSPTFKKVFDKQMSKGKHYNVAISHVAKKLTYIIDHLMQTNEVFKEQS